MNEKKMSLAQSINPIKERMIERKREIIHSIHFL